MIFNNIPNQLLWWGRFDPDYSRNRILRKVLHKSGYGITDFRPAVSPLGRLQFLFTRLKRPDAIWVPAFRQRDFHPARRYAVKHNIPIIFDPLISSWDKVIFERTKFLETDRRAIKLLRWERSMFSTADLVIADTKPHAQFFIETLHASPEKTHVVPVGAEEPPFINQPYRATGQTEILFYGSFINLQGPDVIVKAARLVPELQWTLLGDGPLLETCRSLSRGMDNIRFEKWLPYEQLPARIGRADILLGIFGSSPKAGRVIPNKVYQGLACGRPIVTRNSTAYPTEIRDHSNPGIYLIPPDNPPALANAVRAICKSELSISLRCSEARLLYKNYFSEQFIKKSLQAALASLPL